MNQSHNSRSIKTWPWQFLSQNETPKSNNGNTSIHHLTNKSWDESSWDWRKSNSSVSSASSSDMSLPKKWNWGIKYINASRWIKRMSRVKDKWGSWSNSSSVCQFEVVSQQWSYNSNKKSGLISKKVKLSSNLLVKRDK